MADHLNVYCFDELAGRLWDERPLRFEYDDAWVSSGRPPLAHALPLSGQFDQSAAHAYFGGLLPEGEPRKQIARSLGVSVENDFQLLVELGWDCAGAVSLYPAGVTPNSPSEGEDVKWFDEAELAQLVAELPTRPLMFDGDGELRLSLAGAQDKVPVVTDGERVGLSGFGRTAPGAPRTASTDILKTPIDRLPGTVANEAFCLSLMSSVGLNSVKAVPQRALDREFLLVRRYDRELRQGRVARLQQEDFCQALAIPSEQKYEAEGGPSLAQCFGLIRSATSAPPPALLAMLDATAFNFLVGNHDAHGKNFSLLRSPSGTVLAPFYDVLSTFVYRMVDRRMSPKLAMRVGGEYRWDYIERRHFDRFFTAAELAAPASRRRFLALAGRIVPAARSMREEFANDGWDDPILDPIVELIETRADRLQSVLADN